jgi:hypothetical protein
MKDLPLYKRTDIYHNGALRESWHLTRKSALELKPRASKGKEKTDHITIIEVDERPPKQVRDRLR